MDFPRLQSDTFSTQEVAKRLGLAVRSVQLMVDRGELQAWKTPGGHRRIASASVESWLARRDAGAPAAQPSSGPVGDPPPDPAATMRPVPDMAPVQWVGSGPMPRRRWTDAIAPQGRPSGEPLCKLLLVEDSAHCVNLVRLLVQRRFPEVELHVASDAISGLLMAGRLDPAILIIDILLPGIDGATLMAGLRAHPAFRHSTLLVITALSGSELEPYALALEGECVIHKSNLVTELPERLRAALDALKLHAT